MLSNLNRTLQRHPPCCHLQQLSLSTLVIDGSTWNFRMKFNTLWSALGVNFIKFGHSVELLSNLNETLQRHPPCCQLQQLSLRTLGVDVSNWNFRLKLNTLWSTLDVNFIKFGHSVELLSNLIWLVKALASWEFICHFLRLRSAPLDFSIETLTTPGRWRSQGEQIWRVGGASGAAVLVINEASHPPVRNIERHRLLPPLMDSTNCRVSFVGTTMPCSTGQCSTALNK